MTTKTDQNKCILYSCELCHFQSIRKNSYNTHLLTQKHIKNQTEQIEKDGLICEEYICSECNYTTSKKNNYERHLKSQKHITVVYPEIKNCPCGKKYKFASGLSVHAKTCNIANQNTSSCVLDMSANVILEMVKQNNEFKQIIMEQNQKLIDIASKPTTTVVNTNSNNKFNINFFLNEQCKDALNITDFVKSLKLQLSDLENTGKNGFVEGISKIFIKGLKDLDIYKRPIHCSDVKRETMYVKDQNGWEKEDSEKEKLKKTIDKIAYKNITQIPTWVEMHPKCTESTSKYNDLYLNIVCESMGGIDKQENNKYYEKIVKNVSKEVII